ncbi:MAG: (cytosine-5)-methyltransferase 1 [Thermoleophilaceae bacterium]|jgi:DNA (cytosine-5)-methyltransferase 1|nr:(cytosine-5)-methyltransferase 1 [Thermoleophilaceae bacterium]
MPTTIDLFCGAGGITEGFRQAGYECLYANDISSWAVETFRRNHPGVWAEQGAVEEVNPAAIRAQLGLASGELDVLVGGPPCQGFSINAPERFLDDPRNALFRHYVRFLDEFSPRAFLLENVPGMLSLADGLIFRRITDEFAARGYHVSVKVLFAAHYGVPQERWRLIVLGSRERPLEHPQPTHYARGRANFRGGGSLIFGLEEADAPLLLPAVTVGDALRDLPRLEVGEGSEEGIYDAQPDTPYAAAMREQSTILYNHVAPRLSPQNLERLRHIRPGGSWRDIPFDLLPKGMQRARKSDHTRRYGRLRFEGLAGTIMTKCDPHWGPVFLPDQDRSLTVREAARLQSFPDRYRFLGPRVAQYEQVGNAVPVGLAAAIASALAQQSDFSGRREESGSLSQVA